MPKVYNRKDPLTPKDAVYVGRPTKFGNPFVINKNRSRAEAVLRYKHWIQAPEQAILYYKAREELHGKDLVCYCAPKPCHADVLLEIANEDAQPETLQE